jgi:predicted MFS family arabinose efflux permease
MAIGLVPQMIFLVDFIARDLGRGVAVGSHFYLLYGFGSIIGPFLYNFSVQRIGLRTTLRAGIVVQLISTVLLIISTTDPVLGVASFLAGIGMPAIIAAFLLRSEQISENDPLRHRTLWGRATASFAVGQAIAGCGTAFLIEAFGSNGLAYPLLFYMAAGSLVLAFLIDFTIRR